MNRSRNILRRSVSCGDGGAAGEIVRLEVKTVHFRNGSGDGCGIGVAKPVAKIANITRWCPSRSNLIQPNTIKTLMLCGSMEYNRTSRSYCGRAAGDENKTQGRRPRSSDLQPKALIGVKAHQITAGKKASSLLSSILDGEKGGRDGPTGCRRPSVEEPARRKKTK